VRIPSEPDTIRIPSDEARTLRLPDEDQRTIPFEER
jgi:hypothetical protein